jgi:phage terminase large subunit GpA-like protein
LDSLLVEKFTTTTGRVMRVSAAGVDWGGSHGDMVLSYCRARRGRRIFACKGFAGPAKPIWPGKPSRSKSGRDIFYGLGVDVAKDKIHAALKLAPPTEPGLPKPGFIHFPVAEGFGPEFFEQLNAERRQIKKRLGQDHVVWVKVRERNEALDCLVGCLAMRKSLPRNIAAGLEYSLATPGQIIEPEPGPAQPESKQIEPGAGSGVMHEALQRLRNPPRFVQQPETGWIGPRRGWLDRE